jgi:hypothetical protein
VIFAHNGVGKTRLSRAFKELATKSDTLYFNAFTNFEIQCLSWFPTSYLIVCIASYINLIFVFSLASKIFIADDFALNGKSTNFVAVVKSSKIITGKLSLKTPFISFVKPVR